MRKVVIILCVLTGMPGVLKAQEQEIQQLVLNIEKLAQLKQILSEMKKGYEIVSNGYSTIKDLSQGNFNLHKTYLDGLLAVSPTVQQYKKAGEIAGQEVTLLKEYKAAYSRFRQQNVFTVQELNYLGSVYDKLISESAKNMEELTMVITAGKMRMSDDERIQAIDRIYDDMQDKLSFLRYFNNNTSVMATQRMKEQEGINLMKTMSGVQ